MHTYFAKATGPLMVFPMRGQRMRLIAQIDGADGIRRSQALQVTCDRAGAGAVCAARTG